MFPKRVILGLILILILSGCNAPSDVPSEQPPPIVIANLVVNDAFIIYDADYTKYLDHGQGYGKGVIQLSNSGNGSSEIIGISVFYAPMYTSIDWQEITESVSLDGISSTNPYIVEPLGNPVTLSIRFPIPDLNHDNALFYKLVVTPRIESVLDTSLESSVVPDVMKLEKDRPVINSPDTLEIISRTVTISPTLVTDNAGIKNVTFDIYTDPSEPLITQVLKKTVTSALWRWQWDTYNSSPEGLDNGSYFMGMTVYDYAGLSSSIRNISFILDNDYVKPTISNILGSSTKNGVDIAELGESFSVSATITDSGSALSSVNRAFIFYKFNSSTTYFSTAMLQGSGDLWMGNIPAAFFTSETLIEDINYYIRAIDDDENANQSELKIVNTLDTTEPNFYSHIFEGEPITGQPILEGGENQPLTISVAVQDEDKVSEVFLVWRERNDTTWTRPDPWEVFSNFSGVGEVWNFQINSINVTLDGLDYYFIATDPSGNLAYDGTPLTPYQIVIEDKVIPVSTIISEIPLIITAGTDLTISTSVIDNDPTFSWWGNETGTVELGYKRTGLDPDFNYFIIPHVQGDSTLGQTAVWEGTIKGSNFTTTYSPIYIRIRVTDNNGLTSFTERSIAVSAPGIPVLNYVQDSVSVLGTSDQILRFEINNAAGGVEPATATVTAIQVELSNNTKSLFIGEPQLVAVNVTGGTNPVWENKSSPSEGTNGVKLTLDHTFTILKGSSVSLTLIYANSTGGYFNVNDMTVNATIYYTGGFDALTLFNTPITTFQDFTQTRYMRCDSHIINGLSAYQFGVVNTASFHELNQRSTGSQTVTWGIRVWVRHADSSETELTSGLVATVQRSTDGSGIQSASWTAPETNLAESDALVIRVYMQIGTSTYGPVVFSTEQLGAIKLLSSSWSVYYFTEREYTGFPQNRTRGILSWGDDARDSRIENIQISKT